METQTNQVLGQTQGGNTTKITIGVREDGNGYWLIIGSRKIRADWKPWYVAIRDYVLDFQRFSTEHNGVYIAFALEEYGWVRWVLRIIDSE